MGRNDDSQFPIGKQERAMKQEFKHILMEMKDLLYVYDPEDRADRKAELESFTVMMREAAKAILSVYRGMTYDAKITIPSSQRGKVYDNNTYIRGLGFVSGQFILTTRGKLGTMWVNLGVSKGPRHGTVARFDATIREGGSQQEIFQDEFPYSLSNIKMSVMTLLEGVGPWLDGDEPANIAFSELSGRRPPKNSSTDVFWKAWRG